MVCRKEIRIESIQQIIENKNLKIFMTINVYGHKTLVKVYILFLSRIIFINQRYKYYRTILFCIQE